MDRFRDSIQSLIVQTSTNLPSDVRRALRGALAGEQAGSRSALALETLAQNIDMAQSRCAPICQDTGMPFFQVMVPLGVDQLGLSEEISEAVALATKEGALRPNSVDPLTGRNSGDNLGPGTPLVHFEQWLSDDIEVRLMLKGGGCENVGAQYSLPHAGLGAGRDLEGVRRAALDAVHQAQGQGCAPGVLGIAIGGDRGSSFLASKEALLRPLDDLNPDPALAELETPLLGEANELGIGPMGFGGQTTVLGVKARSLHRLPASFFVSVSYMCWAHRRRRVVVDGESVRFLDRSEP